MTGFIYEEIVSMTVNHFKLRPFKILTSKNDHSSWILLCSCKVTAKIKQAAIFKKRFFQKIGANVINTEGFRFLDVLDNGKMQAITGLKKPRRQYEVTLKRGKYTGWNELGGAKRMIEMSVQPKVSK